jgi:signal transduction histidine kinase
MRLANLDLLENELQVIEIEFDCHRSLLWRPGGPSAQACRSRATRLWNVEAECCSLACITILSMGGFCCLPTVQSGDQTLVQWLTRLSTSEETLPRSVTAQYLLVSVAVLCVAMAVLGTWVSLKVKDSVLVATGVQASNFMEAFIAPHMQNLEPDGHLDEAARQALDNLLLGTPLARTFVSVKIWREDGLVVYATNKDLIGQYFDATYVSEAYQGAIVTKFESITRAENAAERALDAHLIEVYAPLYRTGTSEIIAVAETYENAEALAAELAGSQTTTWLVVGITTSLMVGLLYLIVRRAEATIEVQRRQLRDRYSHAVRTARETAELRQIADRSRLQASEANEQYLGRLGSDIHDGPLQLLTLSILRLTAAAKAIRASKQPSEEALAQVEGTIHITQEAMSELRNVSTGLILPEISGLNLAQTVRLAVDRHQDLTGEIVEYHPEELPDTVNEALKICVYRVIQEGLNNTTKHAPGAQKMLSVTVDVDALMIEVADDGPGLPATERHDNGESHLGLKGMHNRVRALHGSIALRSSSGHGTRLLVRLPIEEATTPSI